ncbi:MAG: hypothetical protein ACLR8Y_00370 [Alistipes indistinctus]
MAYNLLKGKKGFRGTERTVDRAWKVAQRAAEERAEIVPWTNTPVSIRMGTIGELAKACNAPRSRPTRPA